MPRIVSLDEPVRSDWGADDWAAFAVIMVLAIGIEVAIFLGFAGPEVWR